MLVPYLDKKPIVDETVFVAPGAYIIGDVKIGAQSTIWFNAVLRGDEDLIQIGERCSIQDNSTIHHFEGAPVIIGDEVTVGHQVVLHGCKIGNRSIIGMGSVILDHVEIGEECIIGANTLLTQGTKIPPSSLVVGSPGKVVRQINEKDLELIQLSIDTYVQKGIQYKQVFNK
ncbi:gamma carbonic anhydrase family protein [Ureibacillus endophyticus]|uniref:Gamma carbonic anhydrase family protein n=1 Tax=Ureibacillus endophyticus TaxID=1978490 RepID=A0A494Z3B7_9BACL|nr:gamma carbonic anhydrase family protein [Lysinibacillus endophyticus]RKQ17018.1 gamma carbonic anhydrase family protein [Lysinibacillus endophyticus]